MKLDEKLIIKLLVIDDRFNNKAFPYIKKDYFSERTCKRVFEMITQYNVKFDKKITISALELYIEAIKDISEAEYNELLELDKYVKEELEYDFDWACDETEKWIRSRAYYNSLLNAIEIFGKDKLDSSLPDKINEALSITFNTEIGFEFTEAEKRWEMYTNPEMKIPFLVEKLNTITKGGVPRKTLNCLMSATTGGFKSGTMCSLACDYMRQGYNVLYLSFEMAEDKILERIDANFLDTPIDDLVSLGETTYVSRINDIAIKAVSKPTGRLIVKQYPPASIHAGHIKYFLQELKLKKHFTPDVIMFDYLGIMISKRYSTLKAQEHQIIKAACEEVRALCIENNCIGWTGMQSNREGARNMTDLSVSDIASSYDSTFGFDMILALILTEESTKNDLIIIKQIKNRYGDEKLDTTFTLGINKPKMKIYDVGGNNPGIISNERDEEDEELFRANSRRRRANIFEGLN